MATSLHNATASCLVTASFDPLSVTDAVRGCRSRLGGRPDLAIVFVSSDYLSHLEELIEILQIDGHAAAIVGASAEGLYGVGVEHENASGISMLFMRFPDTSIDIQLGPADSGASFQSAPTLDGEVPPGGRLILGNPLHTDLSDQLKQFNTSLPKLPVVGGLIRGGPSPDDLFLFTELGPTVEASISIQFTGGVKLLPIVSQGCRPIGDPLVVTGASRNQILTMGRKEALSVLEETFDRLAEQERNDAVGNVFAGLAITETVDDFATGHFVIRHIVSADLAEGRLMLDSPARIGQTMQFQLRESGAATAALISECRRAKATGADPIGALFFGGYGRGRCLFGEANHDVSTFHDEFGEVPLSGIFTNGEIGPVAGRNFRHDHSLCCALFLDSHDSTL